MITQTATIASDTVNSRKRIVLSFLMRHHVVDIPRGAGDGFGPIAGAEGFNGTREAGEGVGHEAEGFICIGIGNAFSGHNVR